MQKIMLDDVFEKTAAASPNEWCYVKGDLLTPAQLAQSIMKLAKALSDAAVSNNALHKRSKASHTMLWLIYREYVALMGDDNLAQQAMAASITG